MSPASCRFIKQEEITEKWNSIVAVSLPDSLHGFLPGLVLVGTVALARPGWPWLTLSPLSTSAAACSGA